jgi:hypothetical protein
MQDKLRSNLQTFNRNLKIMIPSLSIGGMSPQTGAKLIGGRRST